MWYEADRSRSRAMHRADYLLDLWSDKVIEKMENELEQLQAELAEFRADWSEMVEQRDEAMRMLYDLVKGVEVYGHYVKAEPAYRNAKEFLGLNEHEQDH